MGFFWMFEEAENDFCALPYTKPVFSSYGGDLLGKMDTLKEKLVSSDLGGATKVKNTVKRLFNMSNILEVLFHE